MHLVDNSKIVAYGGMTKTIHQNLKINLRTSVRIFDLSNLLRKWKLNSSQ